MLEFLILPIFYNVLLAVAAIGFSPVSRFGKNTAENLTLSFCMGMGCMSLIILLFGLSGHLYGYFFHSLLIIGVAMGIRKIHVRHIRIKMPEFGYHTVFLILIALALVWFFLTCLTPAYMYDSLEYHFSVPEQYLIENQIVPIFYNLHSNMPLMAHMPWTLLLHYSNVHACKIFIFIQIAALLLLQYSMARRVLNRLWSIVSIFIFLYAYSTLWTNYHVHIGNDITRQLYLNASILCALYFLIQKNKRFLVYSAVFLGFALGTKYFSFLFGIPTLFFILLTNLSKTGFTRRCMEIAAFFAITAAVLSPWLIKQYVHTGNPIYPILYNKFPTGELYTHAAMRRTLYSESGYTGSALDHMITEEAFRPWKVLADNFKRFVTPHRDFLMLPGLFFSLFGLFYRKRYVRILGMIGVLFYLEALLLGAVHWYRYFVTNYTIIAITFTYFFRKLILNRHIPPVLRYIFLAGALLMILELFYVPRISYIVKPSNPPLFVLNEDRFDEFYEKHSLGDYYRMTQLVNSMIPETAKILIFDNYLSYNFQRRRIIPGMDGREAVYHYFWKNKEYFETLQILWEEDIDYIILYPRSIVNSYRSQGLQNVHASSQWFGTLIYEDDNCEIYRVPERAEWYRTRREDKDTK